MASGTIIKKDEIVINSDHYGSIYNFLRDASVPSGVYTLRTQLATDSPREGVISLTTVLKTSNGDYSVCHMMTSSDLYVSKQLSPNETELIWYRMAKGSVDSDGSIYIERSGQNTFNSLKSLSTILNSELSTMLNNEIRHIRLNCNGSFGTIFYSGVAYFIDLKRSSMNYSSCMMQGVGYPSQIFGMLISGVWSFESMPIGNFVVVESTVTTGPTGNISTPYTADNKTFLAGATATNTNAYLRAWRSSINGLWYLTAVNPVTGVTIDNTQLDIRYMVIKRPAI